MKPHKHDPVHMPAVQPRWADKRFVVVAAPGPSLTPSVAERCHSFTVLAIKEAYRLLPHAQVLYGCDAKFWRRNDGCPDYTGEKWSSHDNGSNTKLAVARDYGVKLVNGKSGVRFSLDQHTIHYGTNSGFQAINLALLFGATSIVLVGFDMRIVEGQRYFFGKHPTSNRPSDFGIYSGIFEAAARALPKHIRIVNATPGSALRAFPMVSLDHALAPAAS